MLIGIDAKNGNGLMMQFRQRKGISQAEAARQCGVAYHWWNQLERLHFARVPLAAAEKVASFIGSHIVEIFPEVLRDKNIGTRRIAYKEVEPLSLSAPETQRMLPVVEDNPTEEYEQIEREQAIQRVLATLTYREREIIKLRYGLDGQQYTLEETAKIFKITRERVRSVEIKALNKLRHPVRARILESFIEPAEAVA